VFWRQMYVCQMYIHNVIGTSLCGCDVDCDWSSYWTRGLSEIALVHTDLCLSNIRNEQDSQGQRVY
jgi:hypothetical protein